MTDKSSAHCNYESKQRMNMRFMDTFAPEVHCGEAHDQRQYLCQTKVEKFIDV